MTGRQRRLLASHALSAVAMAMPWPALLAAAWRVDPGWAGVVGAARLAPYVLLSWAVGGVGDRFGRLRVLRWTTVLRTLLLGGAAVAFALGNPVAAAIAALLAVAAGTPAFPSLGAHLPVEPGDAARATRWLVTIEVSAFVVGPALGGLLLGWTEGAAGLFAAAGVALGGVLLLCGLGVGGRAARVVEDEVSLPAGLRAVAAVPAALAAIATVMALNFALAMLGVTLLPLTASAWHGGDPEFGFATAALGFGSLATPVLAGLVRGPTAHRTATLLAALPLVAVWVAPTWLLGLVPLALFGAGATVVECETTRVLQGQAPARYRALALGVADTAMIAAALCGAAAAPWFTGAVGPVAVPALLAVLVAPACWWGLRGSARPAAVELLHSDPER